MKISNFYFKIYLNKGSIIAIALSYMILIFYVLYMVLNNQTYIYNNKIIEKNYISSSLQILNIMLIFIIMFIFIREANLLTDSFDSYIESRFGRNRVFIEKMFTILVLSFILTSSFYLILFGIPYYKFIFLKFQFLKSFLNVLTYVLALIVLFLLIDYLFKNYFITLIFGISLFILGLINNDYLSFIIPSLKSREDGLFLAKSIWYYISFDLSILIIDYILYLRLDRK